MDTFSHAFWGLGLFGYRGRPWWALLFGALPDLLSFGILLVGRIIEGNISFGKPALETIPGWTFVVYDLTHSFVTVLIVLPLVFQWNKGVGFVLLAWPFHILLDFPFHTAAYFPTKLFWPISDFYFSGLSWATPMVWFPNLAGLMLLFLYRFKSSRS
jgi:hypothetical protein